MTDASLDDRLAAYVGGPVGTAGPSVAPDPVNEPMIRHWVAAFEDTNPRYAHVAPPLMLQTWTMATPVITGIAERGGSPTDTGAGGFFVAMEEAGYSATLAVNSTFEIERELHVGERITATTILESVSEEKQTRLGTGRFVTWVTTYVDDAGDVVGRQEFRILKFQPGT
jgi:hypothetical protein